MERGREGRRGGAGGGAVSAPRRPRTSGFKDAQVGEDGDDTMDDIHNSRLRERPKKEGSSVNAVQGLLSGTLGSSSRNKRKRQGSQELQGQVRSSMVDDLDDTTEDTEMGVSDDDDDPPPPPIPRRPGKLRPQGKFMDDGITSDLPPVPRKARTATLKRPQESPVPPVFDLSQQGSIAVFRTPSPASAPSSSSVASLKPGRRTTIAVSFSIEASLLLQKPSGSKLRVTKISKASTPVVSEQEVEVAEALFDLARMFTNQSTSSSLEVSVDMNPEPKVGNKPKIEPKAEPEVKWEPKVLADNIIFPPSHLPPPSAPSTKVLAAVSSSLASSQTSTVAPPASVPLSPSSVMPSAHFPATGSLAIPVIRAATRITSPSFTQVTASPAEAPKRKRPRVRTRPEEVGFPPQVRLPGSSGAIVSNSCALTAPLQRPEQSSTGSPLRAQTGTYAWSVTIAVPNSVTVPSSTTSVLDSLDCSSPTTVHTNYPLEERFVASEKEATRVGSSNTSATHEKKQITQSDRNMAPASVLLPAAISVRETELTSSSMAGNEALPKLELGKLPTQQQSFTSDGSQLNKYDFDLMAPPLMKAASSPGIEMTPECFQNTAEDNSERRPVDIPVISPDDPFWIDMEKGRDTLRHEESENECKDSEGKEGEGENGKDRAPERDMKVNRQRDREDQREASKDREREKERERAELSKHSLSQRLGKALKLESRVQKPERAASASATLAVSSFLPSVPVISSTVATNVSPISGGRSGWPIGLPSIGYYSSAAAAAAVWPSATTIGGPDCVDENPSSGVQLQHPYFIQARQPQPWKRCASHVYIAHFIDLQQQMSRIQAVYQNSTSLYGAKPYNLNIPLPPADALLGSSPGGHAASGVSGVAGVSMITGCASGPRLGIVPGSERHLGPLSLMAHAQSKDRVYGEALSWNQMAQQQQPSKQLSPTLSLQSGPGFGFPVTQASVSAAGGMVGAAPVLNGGGSVGNSGGGGGSPLAGAGSASKSTIAASLGTGGSNGGVASHAVAQAQYLQAVMNQGGFSFPFQAAGHFGPGLNGPPGYIGPQQAAQFFNNPPYTTHLVLPPINGQQQVQNALQQVVRNFSPRSPREQSPLIPLSQLSSHAQHLQGSTSQQMQQVAEREGSNLGDGNSTTDSNISMSQRNMYEQGNCSATIDSVSPPSSLVVGGVQSLPSQDYNLIGVLGTKQAKQHQQGQLVSQQQQQLASQHHASGPAVHMSLKATDQQSSQAFPSMAVGTMTRSSVVGPGPLGLAPVAAVMAPQGHAMLQSTADHGRGHGQLQQSHHLSVSGQSHQQLLQPGQQQLQHRGPVLQGAVSTISGIEDGRAGTDGNTFSSKSGRDVPEDRKLLAKRGMASTSGLSRADLETTMTVQGSCSGVSRMTGSASSTLNLMTPASTGLLSRPSVQAVGSGIQHLGPALLGNQSSKQVFPRNKLLAGPAVAALAPSTQPQLSSLSDRAPPGPHLCSKGQGPPLLLSGQNVQVPRQGQVPQHSQLKLSNRGAVGSLPTPSGTAPQAVLAAAIAKSQQGPQQQQARPQVQVGSNAGPPSKLASINSGGPNTSTGIPLPPLPPASKSAPTNVAKSISASKNSFPQSHKPSSGVSGKRSTAPTVPVPHAPSILGPSPLVQNLHSKSSQNQHHSQPPFQQQQSVSQYHSQPSKLPQLPSQLPQSLLSTQYHHQQAHLTSPQLHQVHNKQTFMQHQQTNQMQRNVFLQNPAFPQIQQGSGILSSAHPQQQSTHLVQQKCSSPSLQPQQHSLSPKLHQQQQSQQQHHHQQHTMQGGPGPFSGTAVNGSLSLAPPTLTLGTGSNGNSNSSRSPGSDNLASPQNLGLRSNLATSKVSSGFGPSPASSISQKSGPSFLHADQTGMPDGTGQEQVNGMLVLSSSPSSRMPQMPLSGSPALQPVSIRSPVGGSSLVKSVGVQFAVNNYGEGTGTRSALVLSATPPSLSSSNSAESSNMQFNTGPANSGGLNSSGHLISDGGPFFGGSSSMTTQVTITSPDPTGSVHQSSLLMASGTTSTSSQNVGQLPKSLAQP